MHSIVIEKARSASPLPTDSSHSRAESPICADPLEHSPRSSGIWINDSLPQYDDRKQACKRRTAQVFSVLSTLVLLVSAFSGGNYLAKRSMERELNEAELVKSRLLEQQKRLLTDKAELGRYSKANAELSANIEELQKQLEGKKAELNDEERRRSLREKEIFQILDQYQQTDGSISQASTDVTRSDLSNFIKTMAYDRYGSGTQQVEFEVRIWEDDESTDASFVVEVASFDLMPASAFFFLEQVDRGLWDGTSFHVNAPHVLMAQPVSGTHDVHKLPEMEAMGLARLPLQEYSEQLPHQKYTLGFGSAPSTAGSFFFINKTDNSNSQAGQPCFARVVSGFDTIDAITSLETARGNYRIQPTEILSAHVLN